MTEITVLEGAAPSLARHVYRSAIPGGPAYRFVPKAAQPRGKKTVSKAAIPFYLRERNTRIAARLNLQTYPLAGDDYEPPILDIAELGFGFPSLGKIARSIGHVSATAGRAVGHVTATAGRTVARSRLGKAAVSAVVGAGVTVVAGPAAGAAAAAGARKILNNANDLLQPKKKKVPLPPTIAKEKEVPAVSKTVKKTTTAKAPETNYLPLAIGGGLLAVFMFM